MGRLKISHKLIGVFGFVLLSLISIGGFAIYHISSLNAAAGLIGSGVDGMAQISESRAALFESQVALADAFSEKAGPNRDALLLTAGSRLDASLSTWKKYDVTCDPGEERNSADTVNGLWKSYTAAVKALRDGALADVDANAVKATLKIGYEVAARMQNNVVYQTRQSSDAVAAATDSAAGSILAVGIGGGVVIALSSILCLLLLKNVTKPMYQLTSMMGLLANNNTSTDVPGLERHDELGSMARAVQVFKSGIQKRIALEAETAENQRQVEEERARNEASRVEAAREQQQVVDAIAHGLEQLSDGGLVFRITDTFAPHYEKLRIDFNGAMETLQDTMKVVSSNTSAIRSGTDEISSAADDLSRRTEQQAASLEETAAALGEITSTVRKTAEGANHARQVVGTAKKDAEHSGEVVRQAVEAMSGIEKSSGQISQIIGVIDEIAFQTNLLALNAGVEAARAGDAGRGFAVVASEVRALAQRSANAAKEIKSLISASAAQVEQGVGLVGETGRALERIVTQVNEIDAIVGEIAVSAQEQATGLDQVNTAVNQMDEVTQQNAAMVEESTAASHALTKETEELAHLISRFRVGQPTAGAAAASVRPALGSAPKTASRPVTALKTTARGGAVRKLDTHAEARNWENV